MQNASSDAIRLRFATWALNGGMNPVTLQKILGHGSMEMIAVWYAHESDDDNYAAMLRLLTTDGPGLRNTRRGLIVIRCQAR